MRQRLVNASGFAVGWLRARVVDVARRLQVGGSRSGPHGVAWRGAWVAALLFAVFAGYIFMPAGLSTDEVYVRVTAGSGAKAIGLTLQRQGLVRSADVFVLWTRLLGAQGALQAGEYKLHSRMSPPAIVWLMKSGRVADTGVTIPEGYDLRQIAEALAGARLVDKEEFLAKARHASDIIPPDSPLQPPDGNLEGYLFPDTYRIAPGASIDSILRLMFNRTVEQVAPLLEKAALPAGFNAHDVLTLASIVEKEAVLAAERPLIAGVFLNRLRRDMPLQSDPTVKYVLSPAPVRLSNTDIAIDSPYNTYRHKGLPPGPIASPGLASVQAVLQPQETTYLYFVASGDGAHIFSDTFAEHVAARKRLQAQSQ